MCEQGDGKRPVPVFWWFLFFFPYPLCSQEKPQSSELSCLELAWGIYLCSLLLATGRGGNLGQLDFGLTRCSCSPVCISTLCSSVRGWMFFLFYLGPPRHKNFTGFLFSSCQTHIWTFWVITVWVSPSLDLLKNHQEEIAFLFSSHVFLCLNDFFSLRVIANWFYNPLSSLWRQAV